MYNIPVELLLGIVDCVEDNSLPNLRLVSKHSTLSPRHWFSNGEATTNAVQEIVFQGNPKGSARRLAPPPQWRDEDISDGAGRDALCRILGLAKFCNLTILRFDFHNRFRELETHSKNAARLTSLTVRSDQSVGVRPAAPLATIHFPALASLLLHDFVLGPADAKTDVLELIPTFVVSPSLAGVRKVAADVNVYSDPIHVFIRNAAAAIGSPSTRLSTRPNPETCNSTGAFFEVKAANFLTAVELSKRSKGALNAYSLYRGVTNAVLTSITKTRLFANEDVVAADPLRKRFGVNPRPRHAMLIETQSFQAILSFASAEELFHPAPHVKMACDHTIYAPGFVRFYKEKWMRGERRFVGLDRGEQAVHLYPLYFPANGMRLPHMQHRVHRLRRATTSTVSSNRHHVSESVFRLESTKTTLPSGKLLLEQPIVQKNGLEIAQTLVSGTVARLRDLGERTPKY
ncbi:hypothetical protein B0H13DRAFT_2539339 [Mycena leptocephala]|nr:hypothetical protein B0H13DRAFT_2539339 [Mycena leptocephala]